MLHNPEFTRCCAGQNQSIVIQSAALFDIVNAGPKAADDAPRLRSCIARRRRETGPDHFNTFTQRLQNENQLRPAEGDKGVRPQALDLPRRPQKQGEVVNAGMGSRDGAAHSENVALLSGSHKGGGW
jgi:hypothetical protein